MDDLTEEQKDRLREEIAVVAAKLIGVPYVYGAEWTDLTKPPAALDCSELVENIYKIKGLRMDDGSQNQFNMTVPAANPKLMDLAFFGKGGDPAKVYHVGLVFRMGYILEARGFDPNAKFTTGMVILRPMTAWEAYKPNFLGYRAHPKLV